MAQGEQDEPVGLESGSGSGGDAPAMPGQPPPSCTPRPAGTRGDVSLPVTPARLRQGLVYPFEASVLFSRPLGWRGGVLGATVRGMGKGVMPGGYFGSGTPRRSIPLSLGCCSVSCRWVPRAPRPPAMPPPGTWGGLLGSGPGRGGGMLWDCSHGFGAQWPFVCRAAPGTSRHPSFPVT